MPQQQWFGRLRGQIKDRCGVGWGIADRHGDTQLTRRINDGKQHENPRQSVQLGVPWNPAFSGDIFLKVCQLKQLVDERHCSLADAYQQQDAPGGDLIAGGANQGMDPYQAQRVQYQVLA